MSNIWEIPGQSYLRLSERAQSSEPTQWEKGKPLHSEMAHSKLEQVECGTTEPDPFYIPLKPAHPSLSRSD